MPKKRLTIASLGILACVQAGCAATAPEPSPVSAQREQAVMYVQTSGAYHRPDKALKGGVWVRNSAPQAAGIQDVLLVVKGAFLERGFDIVEREQLPVLMEEQQTQLRYGDDRDTDQVSVGKIIGARWVALVDLESRPATGYWEGYHLAVSVRVIGVESGAVHYLGIAKWSQPVPSPTYGVDTLATRAVSRAFCPPERWEEAGAANGWAGACHE